MRAIEYNENYINSLLEVLEANISFIPSSTSINEIADISLLTILKQQQQLLVVFINI